MDFLDVSVQRLIPAKKWRIFRLLSRPQDYPAYIPSVKQALVLEKSRQKMVVAWAVQLDELPLSWTEENILDPKRHTLSFRAIQGDLECFEGAWTLRSRAGGDTEVCLKLRIKIGIPMIESLLGQALTERIQKSFEGMLDAIAGRLTVRQEFREKRLRPQALKGFGVIGHPFSLDHLIHYLKRLKPEFRVPSRDFLSRVFEMTPSYQASQIKGFRSKTGKTTDGVFIACTFVPEMVASHLERVFDKVKQACKLAERLGIGIVTLGGFTSIATEKYGSLLLEQVDLAVTTGNTFTVAMVLEGVRKAAGLMDLSLERAKVAVIGGSGDIGGTCARMLAPEVAELVITGRNERSLLEMQQVLRHLGKAKVEISLQNNEAIRGADIVIAAASASGSVVDFKHFKSGAVVCDVGYPKNISYSACERQDLLVFSGGMASIPSDFEVGFDMGLPASRVLYGCFSEAIILDLEECFENYSYGRGFITKEKIEWIREAGKKHGFELAPFFWGHRLLQEEDIQKIREARHSQGAAR